MTKYSNLDEVLLGTILACIDAATKLELRAVRGHVGLSADVLSDAVADTAHGMAMDIISKACSPSA